MENTKLNSCQKYFIFKIQDLVNNSFHTFEEKRIESLTQYIGLCIETYDELRMSLDQTKLKRSYEGLLEGLDYQMQNHPFRKLDLYRNDISYLHRLICLGTEARDKEFHNIHRGLVALKKKVQASNIIESYMICLHHEESFKEVDFLMEALVSDLLYLGYSMAFISEWFKKQQQIFIDTGNVTNGIVNLKDLDKKPRTHKIYIRFKIMSQSQVEDAIQLLKKQFTIQNKEEIKLLDKWFQEGYYFASKDYLALDVTKAIDMASKEFSTITELFDMWQSTKSCIKDDLWYGWFEGNEFYKKEIRRIDNIKMIGYIDRNYKKQMERFLALKDNLKSEDIRTLERILYTLNAAKKYTTQNRFLNFWSSLEYILYPFPRFTIIEKARVVVPEVFSLFYIKNKINIFWSRLEYALSKKDDKDKIRSLVNFVDNCKDKEEGGYVTKKVISYFQDEEQSKEILSDLSFHIVLEREYMEIYMLLNEPLKAYSAIQLYYDGIKHDLNYIYRLRNQLIHSAKDIEDSLEYISFRLYRYVNSVLSTILYYEEKNSAYNITDILSAINATYQDYSDKWCEEEKKKRQAKKEQDSVKFTQDEGYRMVRPPYLFME